MEEKTDNTPKIKDKFFSFVKKKLYQDLIYCIFSHFVFSNTYFFTIKS